jgi:hypothetical protein
MKAIVRIATVLVVGLALAGCYFEVDPGAGAVGIEIPDPRAAGEDSDQSIGRIYLINGITLVDISEDGGTGLFREVDLELEENEVSVGPVPSGPGYRVVVALGDLDEDTDVFVPERYAWTEDAFNVIAGQAVDVDLETVATPFGNVVEVLGEDLVGISYSPDNGGAFYTASRGADSSVFRLDDNPVPLFSLADDALLATVPLPTGQTANSIGYGADAAQPAAIVPWINTNEGVIPYNTATNTLDTAFFSDYPSGATTPDVLSSGAFVVADADIARPGEEDLFGWFQVDGGIGGVFDQDDGSDAGPKQWLTDIDLSTFLSGEPITDLVVVLNSDDDVEAYFASKLGAFMLPQDVLSNPDIDEVDEILDAAEFFEVIVNGQKALITELAVVDTDIYLGTNRGVVSAPLSELSEESITPSGIVSESLGRRVVDMEIGDDYHVILTDNLLIVSDDSGLTYQVLPIYAGIVTEPTAIFLFDAPGAGPLDGLLLISGETGIATLDISNL